MTQPARTLAGEGIRVDFIVGMARSGTTWLGRALAEHPEIAVFGETSFWGRLSVPPLANFTYGRKELERVRRIQREREWSATTFDDSGCLEKTPPGEYAALIDATFAAITPGLGQADVFRQMAGAIARSEGKRHVVEKTPHHVHWLPRIATALPESRFVVLVRDPGSFMISFLHLGNRLDGALEKAVDRPWRHPLIGAVAWRGYMRSIERAVAGHGDRVVVVESAELLEQPREALDRVQRFLGVQPLDLASGVARRNSSFRRRHRPLLRSEDAFWLKVVAGSVARRNGYEIPRVPRRPLHIVGSLITAPLAAGIAAARLPWMVRGSFADYLSRWLSR